MSTGNISVSEKYRIPLWEKLLQLSYNCDPKCVIQLLLDSLNVNWLEIQVKWREKWTKNSADPVHKNQTNPLDYILCN